MHISRNTTIVRSLAAWALAGASALAQAGPVGYTAWDVSGNDKLLRIDLATGAGTVVGSNIGFSDVDGMSFDGSGRLWGVDDDTNRLLQIDLNTGVGTAVGSFGSGFNDMGLAFGNGVMYMAATDSAGVVGSLYTVNTGTGAASLVGAFGFNNAGQRLRVRSLGFYNGVLYGWSNRDTVLTINTSTGAATTVGAFGFPSLVIGQDGFDIDPATGIGWSVAEVENRTYTLNLQTGAASIVASSLSCDGGSCSAGGFNSLAIQAVPEPGSLGLLLAGMGSLGWVNRRRRG
ncbi:PEP-CTERM putative exosortase interaction domain-containing protein [Burkholderiales bacterium JOSHI_001]|nr:PEP-CTERM putative exosortase interaction domain-containing protein [Burkholderiales bacterium JOSHI_001]